MKMIKSYAPLIHSISFLGMIVGTFMASRMALPVYVTVLGLSLLGFMISYFFGINQKEEKNLLSGIYWYGVLYINMFFMKIFTSCLNAIDLFNGLSYILVILLLFAFTFSFLWTSKKRFTNIIHILNIIVISTYLMIELAELFSLYYEFVYAVDIPVDYGNQALSYIKFSLRYFFEFPPQKYLDIVTFLQFVIGKVYEAVLLGGVVSGFASAFVNNKTDSGNIEE